MVGKVLVEGFLPLFPRMNEENIKFQMFQSTKFEILKWKAEKNEIS